MKLIFWILVVAVIGVAVLAIRLYQQNRETRAQQAIHAATTNVMDQLKPDTSPAIFPNK
jgi:Tfp pilus assembly protein PilV